MSTHIGTGYAPALPPWLARLARRAVLLVWWTLTLQLLRRFALWRRARQIRRRAPITPALTPALVHETDPRRIRVPRSLDPTVSVIIPSYGKLEYTLGCLASIAAHPSKVPIEVIVVDDATPDGSTVGLTAVPGIRLIVNPINLVVKIRRLSPLRSVGLPGIQPLSRGTKRQILSTRIPALLQYRRPRRQWRVSAATEQ
jgi:cellulose synthase/poly-beta-1,6-N-acetylglucosamine synthase-like glycosyltransferase